jgi:orotate phosphoribosyltransferase
MSPLYPPPVPSAQVARALVRVGAVRLAAGQPFIYTSGWASPVYVDTRLLMSDVALRTLAMDIAAARLADVVAERAVNAIIGAESSGIAFAAWIAERLRLPLLYLRKKPMGWGQTARVEGRLPTDARLLFVDDVTTDGRSKIAAARTLREAGTRIGDVLVVLDYGHYPDTAARWAEHDLALHALTTWRDLLTALREAGDLNPDTEATLDAFTADPVAWSIAHGGVGA